MTTRILISGGLAGGGIATQVKMICALLKRHEVELTCCATRSEWAPADLAALESLGVRVLLPRFGASGAITTWPWRLRREFDVVYCPCQGNVHRLTRHFLKRGGISVYHEVLCCPAPGSTMARQIPRMDVIVANSRIIGTEMSIRWPKARIEVIPFLTAGRSQPIIPRRPPVGGRELKVVYLGRLVRHKRPEELIRSWKLLSQSEGLRPSRLDIYGDDLDPSTLPRYRQLVAYLGLSEQVTCHGAYDHSGLPKILATADLVVLPSEWEGLPLVLVEAMQQGVPIVATAVGGTEELGEGNSDVVITDPKWESFTAGLQQMAARIRQGQIDSQRLQAWTESHYGYEVVSRRWLSLLLPRVGA